MDTKARVALFVGGLVVVGLVAWVLMPAPKPASNGPAADGSTEVAAAPATQPIALTDPFAAPATQPAAAPSVVSLGGPVPAVGPVATAPTAATPAAEPNDAWARALDGNSSTASMTGGTNIPAVASTGFPRTYKIQSGETFSSISEKAYGNSRYALRIAAANPNVDARRLKVGQEITLPDLNGTAATAAPATPTLATAAPTNTGDHAKTYKIQSGDNLRRISQKVYGTPDRWEKIYSANKSAIGADPGKLKAGQTLQIP